MNTNYVRGHSTSPTHHNQQTRQSDQQKLDAFINNLDGGIPLSQALNELDNQQNLPDYYPQPATPLQVHGLILIYCLENGEPPHSAHELGGYLKTKIPNICVTPNDENDIIFSLLINMFYR